jgi:hypothetical protein
MEIPALLYGHFEEVNTLCYKALKRLSGNNEISFSLDAEAVVDTKHNDGLLILDGPNTLLSKDNHFHCYLPWSMIKNEKHRGRLSGVSEHAIFEQSISTPWGILGLLSPANVMWIVPADRRAPFLHAVVHWWPLLYAEGNRYSVGSNSGQDLWAVRSNIKFVLANLGVPQEVLSDPLSADGLEAVIRLANADQSL